MTRIWYSVPGDETLVDKGEYIYYENDVRQPISEHWLQSENNQGDTVIRSWRQAGDSVRLSAYAEYRDGRRVLASLCWEEGDCRIHADYDLMAGSCYWQRGDSERWFDSEKLELESVLVYPLMRIFTGEIIRDIANNNGSDNIVVPDIRPDTLTADKLKPLLSGREVRLIAEDELAVSGGVETASCWEFTGDQYTPGSKFYLDINDRLLRYCWSQSERSHWRVELV